VFHRVVGRDSTRRTLVLVRKVSTGSFRGGWVAGLIECGSDQEAIAISRMAARRSIGCRESVENSERSSGLETQLKAEAK
jgi:hypothetical protein